MRTTSDADPYKDIAASGQKLTRGSAARDGHVVPGGNGRGQSVSGRRRRPECRRERTAAGATDLQRTSGCSLPPATQDARSASRSTSGTNVLGHPRRFVMEHAYWGPEYPEIGHSAGHRGRTGSRRSVWTTWSGRRPSCWRTGRSSAGIRAGWNGDLARSATAVSSRIPRRADMKHIINSKVKFREPYRPFAPSVLEEDASRYFHIAAGRPS